MNTITNKLNIKYFITLIFILFPISFIAGPALVEIFNLILIIFFFQKVYENRELLKEFSNKIIITLLIFNIIILITSINSDYIFSIKYPLTYFRYIIFVLSIFLLLKLDSSLIKKIIYLFVFVLILLFFGSIYEMIFKNHCGYFANGNVFITEGEICKNLKDYLVGNLSRHDRVSSFFGDELVLGSYVSRFLPFIIGLIYFHYSKINNSKILIYFVILLSLILIIISGERAALIYFIFFGFIFFIIVNERLINKIYLILSLTVILIVSYFSFDQVNKRMHQTYNQIEISINKKILFSTDHHSHAVAAYKIFLDNKFLGTGPNTFREVCKNKKYFLNYIGTELNKNNNDLISGCSTHPHNLYLQLLAETGIIGILIPVVLQFLLIILIIKKIIYLYKNDYNNNKKNNNLRCEILLLSSFFISVFPFIPSGNFFHNWLNFIYFYPLGFYLYVKKYAN